MGRDTLNPYDFESELLDHICQEQKTSKKFLTFEQNPGIMYSIERGVSLLKRKLKGK